ncbi:hypothetical protein RFI_35594 [Reticulomyxa filosa]|uniref:RING-type domain-containing protein n=1 Tax=Reticulomyxa filosa TaxID=46433 RepID=X6LMA6_RETFI|nr:hypothetical protein RFI_35594 [Reticulomyxa filosa]|eukprot:ETO01845.1 hypothetical protein RFI_35594 [Reticulomyxa filosa]
MRVELENVGGGTREKKARNFFKMSNNNILSVITNNPQLYLSLKQKGLNDDQILTVLEVQQKQKEEEVQKKKMEEETLAKKMLIAKALEKRYNGKITAESLMPLSMEKLIHLFQSTTDASASSASDKSKVKNFFLKEKKEVFLKKRVLKKKKNVTEEKSAANDSMSTLLKSLKSTSLSTSNDNDENENLNPKKHVSKSNASSDKVEENNNNNNNNNNASLDSLAREEDWSRMSLSQLRVRCREMSNENQLLKQELGLYKGGDKMQLATLSLEELNNIYLNLQKAIQTVKQQLDSKYYLKFVCPQCRDRNKDTVIVPCGHSFCAQCLEVSSECPQCMQSILRTVPLV